MLMWLCLRRPYCGVTHFPFPEAERRLDPLIVVVRHLELAVG
jgi:hypothetical protein